MKLPYGYVLVDDEIVIHEERADTVRSIFEYYLAGASLGKIVDMLFEKGIPSPNGCSLKKASPPRMETSNGLVQP